MSEEQENSLINIPGAELQSAEDDKLFNEVSTSGAFLPRLQLMTSNSEKCKSGEFPVNKYAVVRGQDYKDIGEDVDVAVIAWRPKAIEMGDEVVAVYDPQHAEFTRIREKSEETDSACMYGPEFLIWSVDHGFLTFFMGSKTARNEAPTLRGLIGKAATLKSRLVKNSRFSWQAPQITVCSSFGDTRPDPEEAATEFEKFKNPPATDIEIAEEPESDREV